MIPGIVSIHPVSPGAFLADADGVLTDTEKTRAAAFRFHKDAARWIKYRAALRRILGDTIQVPPRDVPIVFTESGKPVLAPPFDHLNFSLSHCDDLALVALCLDGPVGVDLEAVSRAPDLSGCESSFCHPAEIAALPLEPASRSLRLLEIWTAKEALLKALGTGFSHPPDTITVHFGGSTFAATSDTSLPGINEQVIHRLRHPLLSAHCAALSAPASVSRIEIIPSEESTSGTNSSMTSPRCMKSDG